MEDTFAILPIFFSIIFVIIFFYLSRFFVFVTYLIPSVIGYILYFNLKLDLGVSILIGGILGFMLLFVFSIVKDVHFCFSSFQTERRFIIPEIQKSIKKKKKEMKIYPKNESKQIRNPIGDPDIVFIRAVPVRMDSDNLKIKVVGKGKVDLILKRIAEISVVKIESKENQPAILIDLILEAREQSGDHQKNIIRFYVGDFNPRDFFKNVPDAVKALEYFILSLIKYGEAKPIHGIDFALLKKIKTFDCIEDYHRSLRI